MKKLRNWFLGIVLVAFTFSLVAKAFLEFESRIFHRGVGQMVKQKLPDNAPTIHPVIHKTLQQDGYSIHYYLSGNPTGQLIIFLHPAFGDHRCFDSQIEFFGRDHRVVTIDLLGHGRSRLGSSADGIDASHRHLEQIMETEGYERAHLVGVSLGALIAQDFASKHPGGVRSIVAVGGYDIHADAHEHKMAQSAQRKVLFGTILRVLFSMSAFRSHVALTAVNSPEPQARFYEATEGFTRKSFRAMAGFQRLLDPRKSHRAPYPLLILNGENEPEAVALVLSERWNGRNGGDRFKLIKNAGHCANMDNPGEFNAVVREFLLTPR